MWWHRPLLAALAVTAAISLAGCGIARCKSSREASYSQVRLPNKLRLSKKTERASRKPGRPFAFADLEFCSSAYLRETEWLVYELACMPISMRILKPTPVMLLASASTRTTSARYSRVMACASWE